MAGRREARYHQVCHDIRTGRTQALPVDPEKGRPADISFHYRSGEEIPEKRAIEQQEVLQ